MANNRKSASHHPTHLNTDERPSSSRYEVNRRNLDHKVLN